MRIKNQKATRKPQYLRILALLGMLAIVATVAGMALDNYNPEHELGSYVEYFEYAYQWKEGYIGYAPHYHEYEEQINYIGHNYPYSYPLQNNDYPENEDDYSGYIGYAPDYNYSWYDAYAPDYEQEHYYIKSCDCHGYVRHDVFPNIQHNWFAGTGDAYAHAHEGYIGIASFSTHTLPATPPIPSTIVNTPNVATNIAQINAEITWIQNNGSSANAYRIRLQFPGNVLNINTGTGIIAFVPALGNRHIILDANDGAPNQVWNNNVANQRHISINSPAVTVELRNVTLSRNPNLTSNGGGVYLSAGRFIMNHPEATIRYNRAPMGGGIYADGFTRDVYIVIARGRVRNNIADNNGGGIGYCCRVSMWVADGVYIYNNVSTNGGGIFNGIRGLNHLFILGGEIRNNTAIDIGGGIHNGMGGSNLIVVDGDIRYNRAVSSSAGSGSGGGIAHVGGQATFYGGSIYYNHASGSGGGIFIAGGDIRFDITYPLTILGNRARFDGGGIYIEGTNPINNTTNTHFTICDLVTISNNTAGRNGGGLFVQGSRNATLRGTINNNGHPQSVYTAGGSHSVTALNITQTTINTHSGGGVHVGPMGTLRVYYGYIIDNEALGTGTTGGYGGGISVEWGSLLFEGQDPSKEANITKNKARIGGGIHLSTTMMQGVNLTANNTSLVNIIDNDALHDGGGMGMSLTLSSQISINEYWTINENVAGHSGGGVYIRCVSGTPQFHMNGGNISENTAGHSGGGVYMRGVGGTPQFNMNGGNILENDALGIGVGADAGGGGIFIGGNIVFNMNHGSLIAYNNAYTGGGIRVLGRGLTGINVFLRPELIMHGGIIRDNTALGENLTNHGGGGVEIETTGAVTPGIYNGSGGGIYVVRNAGITIANTTIANNHAYEMGGGIFTEWYQYYVPTLTETGVFTNLTIANTTTFEYNTAGQGDFLPPINAYTWTNIPGQAQGGSQSIHNHPINNYDINFRREAITTVPFAFHKTTASVYTAPNLVNIADINPFLLEGAYFTLFRFEGTGTPPSTVIYPSADWERVYTNERSTGLLADPITMGLTPGGIYHLVETFAPAGFQIPFGQWRITHDDDAPGDFVIITVGGSAPGFEYLDGYFYVGNVPMITLPLTGGLGSKPVLWAGVLMLVIGFGVWGHWSLAGKKRLCR
ncbi:MAG: hypothetical protein FWE42_00535 [Defluviitaleaceae bacterium]|nr:hypothetical protein [Defluviitaleaceae bacterium]